jgi:uncharacterized protein YjdB
MTVRPPFVVGVTLNSGPQNIRFGDRFNVAASVETRGTLPRTVTFATSNSAVATVSSTDGINATVVAVGAGLANITATSTADASKASPPLPVTVSGTVRIPSVTPSPVIVRAGLSVKLTPTVQADPGVSTAVTYQSGNISIATVANDGTVTGGNPGQTVITVKSVGDPSVTFPVPVTVRSGVTSVSLSPDRDTLRVGAVRQLSLQVVAEAGVSTAVALTPANPAVATIDGAARVTAVAVGQTYVRALALADPSIGDSTLIVVQSACTFHQNLTFGVAVSGTVSASSCNGTDELFAYQVNSQMTLSSAATVQFPANFTFVFDKSGGYYYALGAGGSATGLVVAAPGRYAVGITATNISLRGSFAVSANANVAFGAACGAVATTGVTVLVPLNSCSYQPVGRPVGTYYSFNFGLLPFIPAGQQFTVTITAPAAFVPLVEVRFGSNAPIQAIQVIPGAQTFVQTFTAPAGGAFASVTVTSVNPNQVGNVNVKLEGPPSISYDAFVVGSGILTTSERPESLLPPSRRLVPFTLQQPVRP